MHRSISLKMRLDLYLFEKGLTKSRTEAKNLIAGGAVKLAGSVVTKPSYEIYGDVDIEILRCDEEFVSRGGLKLKAALMEFDASVRGKKCLDIGASTGGFTDCLLKNGAMSVVAIDSGTMQLAESLRLDERVFVKENYNARYMTREDVGEDIEFAVMDVSFISATYIIPRVYEILNSASDFICLVKPQFEVGRQGIGKGGIVKSQKLREQALKKVCSFAEEIGFTVCGTVTSPITGGDGNTEYLVHFKKN